MQIWCSCFYHHIRIVVLSVSVLFATLKCHPLGFKVDHQIATNKWEIQISAGSADI